MGDIVAPLLGQARSLKEGQDLKGAYQIYAEVLTKEPGNKEAITQMNEIRGTLEEKAKKKKNVYEPYDLNTPAIVDINEIQKLLPHRQPFLLIQGN